MSTQKMDQTKQKMMKPFLLFCIVLSSYFNCIKLCSSFDSNNIFDACPTDTSTRQTIFMNGFPCKSPTNISASDFKTSRLNHVGDTNNFDLSSTNIVTAADFPGLNSLGLSVARTDLEVDGMVVPHSHPRASEMIFVSKGVVFVGFVDAANNKPFQKVLKEGDVFVFPKGLLHYCLNSGFELATVFSVLNSQNPGVVSISNAMFDFHDSEAMKMLKKKLISLSTHDNDQQCDSFRDL